MYKYTQQTRPDHKIINSYIIIYWNLLKINLRYTNFIK